MKTTQVTPCTLLVVFINCVHQTLPNPAVVHHPRECFALRLHSLLRYCTLQVFTRHRQPESFFFLSVKQLPALFLQAVNHNQSSYPWDWHCDREEQRVKFERAHNRWASRWGRRPPAGVHEKVKGSECCGRVSIQLGKKPRVVGYLWVHEFQTDDFKVFYSCLKWRWGCYQINYSHPSRWESFPHSNVCSSNGRRGAASYRGDQICRRPWRSMLLYWLQLLWGTYVNIWISHLVD